jgi:hypothetical protein
MHLEAVVHAHAAAFLGRSPWEVAHDEALLADAHATAWRCYRHRTVVAGIDPRASEVEGWGAHVREAAGEPGRFEVAAPVLGGLAELKDLPELAPASGALMRTALGAARRLVEQVPGGVAVPVAGPLAIALALAGRDRVKAGFESDAPEAGAALASLAGKMRPWLQAIGAAGARVTIWETTFDGTLVSAEAFRTHVKPALALLVREAEQATCAVPDLLMEGDTTLIVADLCSVGAAMVVCPAGANRIEFLERARGFCDVSVRIDVAPGLWNDGNWPGVCEAIAEARPAARRHPRTILGTGPLPLHASSVMVVDACSFAANMDPWIEPT